MNGFTGILAKFGMIEDDTFEEEEECEQPTSQTMNKIFISWSGDKSKRIALELKQRLENDIFGGKLNCFVSDVDIASGADWWKAIQDELNSCKMGIVCITKENLRAPWIHFESGAMVARNLKTIPLLVQCKTYDLNKTPLATKHAVVFDEQEKFVLMIKNINKELNILEVTDKQLKNLTITAYNNMNSALEDIFTQLKNVHVFSEKHVYPTTVKTVNKHTLYISVPMSSLDDSQYKVMRTFVENLKIKLINDCGFISVESPILEIDSPQRFDGNRKAIHDNFRNLKQVDSLLVIYPEAICSSILVEVGYALALSKKTVIFYKDKLPYILNEAGQGIKHINTIKYDTFADIEHEVCSNARVVFEIDEEDDSQ